MQDSLEGLKRIPAAWEEKKTMLAKQGRLRRVTKLEGLVFPNRQEEPVLMPNKQEILTMTLKTREGPKTMPDSQEGLKMAPKKRE